MVQKLTEEQQRSAHKIIVANRGDCAKGSNYLYCIDCAHYNGVKSCLNYRSPAFQAENLRRSQAPEKVVDPKPVANTPTPEAKEKGDTTVKGDVDKLPLWLRFINFRDLLPVDALRIIELEGQVDDLTKKLAASKKLCDRLQRRLRAKWEATRDEEMATREEIIAWFDSKKGAAMISYEGSKICPNGHTTWIPATRGNLKL